MSEKWDHKDRLNRMNPAANRVELGSLVQELIDKHNALLAKLDVDTGVNSTNYASTLSIANLKER
jgi:hypothetical protein